jgi:glucose-6-phosphate isomerase
MELWRGSAKLGRYEAAIGTTLNEFRDGGIMSRILAHDHSVWKESPTDIADRLGWLSPADMQGKIAGINRFVDAVRADGYRYALLLGMGGSSLAAEVFRNTLGVREGYLDLAVLDSTDPCAVLHYAETLDLAKTLFIVATKSGGTVETFSFMKYFYNLAVRVLGKEQAGRNFVAITDPGSALADLAAAHNFRAAFLNDPHIGGRYSALSYFGLVPAALIGIDIEEFLARAVAASESDGEEQEGINAAFLGVAMGELAKAGRDKLTFVISPRLAAFGVWLEQLIAESTGKEGKGILPVVGEPLREAADYLNDRVFVFLNLKGDERNDTLPLELQKGGHPLVILEVSDPLDLGAQCFLWEMATAVAGSRLSINPFDQPDVEAAKKLARAMIAAYKEGGKLPDEIPAMEGNGITVYGDVKAANPGGALAVFLAQAEAGAYTAIQAYVRPTADTDAALSEFRRRIGRKYKIATTSGYGPRFLHSTGQLHKGDGGRGLFIQITADDARDAAIPDEMGKPASSLTFGILKAAQAAGDRGALISAGRHVIRFRLGKDVPGGLQKLIED